MKMNKIGIRRKIAASFLFTVLFVNGCGNTRIDNSDYDNIQLTESNSEDSCLRSEYREALINSINNNIMPDGSVFPSSFDEKIDRFAIIDINNDEKDELILDIESVDTATNGFYVYSIYESDVKMMLYVPDPIIYSNGIILSQWSKIPPKALNFRPYDLYIYNETQECFQYYASVDAWNKSVEEDGIAGYPEEADISNYGFVYYISDENGIIDYDSPVDRSSYEKWLSNFELTDELAIPFNELSPEIITNL